MQKFQKILAVICTGMAGFAVTAAAEPIQAVETLQQARAVVQIKGVVHDSGNQPIIGATVMEVGSSNNGTVTASDGSFSISVPKGASLNSSYIDYKSITVRAMEGRTMDILLQEDSEMLNDVVVVGYGVQPK